MSDVSGWPLVADLISSVLVVSSSIALSLTALRWVRDAGVLKSRTRGWGTALVLFLGLWSATALTLGSQEVFASRSTNAAPFLALGFLPFAALLACLAWSKGLRLVTDAAPSWWLVAMQAFRMLGLIFVVAWAWGKMPAEFALPAGIGDVLVGLDAPLVALALRAGRKNARAWAVVWNVLGIADLVTAVTLGVLTSPGPTHLLALSNPNTAISTFPFVLVPSLMAPFWLFVHVVTLRKLRLEAKTSV